jgi:hypothetical protein
VTNDAAAASFAVSQTDIARVDPTKRAPLNGGKFLKWLSCATRHKYE